MKKAGGAALSPHRWGSICTQRMQGMPDRRVSVGRGVNMLRMECQTTSKQP